MIGNDTPNWIKMNEKERRMDALTKRAKIIENLEKQLQVSKEINQKLIDDLNLQKQYVEALNKNNEAFQSQIIQHNKIIQIIKLAVY